MTTSAQQRITIKVPYLPDRVVTPNGRGNWREVWQGKRQAKEDAMALIREQGWFADPLPFADMTYHFHAGDLVHRDLDNLVAGAKPFLDALVTCGVIENDDTAHIRMREPIYTCIQGGTPSTTITVERAEKGDDHA